MIVHCPQCQAKYRVGEKQYAGRQEVKVRCNKCDIVFTAPVVARPAEGKEIALSVTEGPLKGKVFPIAQPRVVLGRAGADIVIDDPEISRQHCALEVHGATATLTDLGSLNGTFVNRERVDAAELEHLSEFHIGRTTLRLTVSDKT